MEIDNYSIEILSRNNEWGAIFLHVRDHPDFSYRSQELTVASKKGGTVGKLRDIDVYGWLEEDQYNLPDEELKQLLMEALI